MEYVRKILSSIPIDILNPSDGRERTEKEAFTRDIADCKRQEEELRNTRAQLATAHKQVQDATESANRNRATFLTDLSREIRTPLNGILGLTNLVLDTELSVEQREYLDGVKTSANALLLVINDILEFSKIEVDELYLDAIAFDLGETLGDSMKALAFGAQAKGLELLWEIRPDVPNALIGDPDRLRQILISLVSNGVKFTPHGEIAVSVELESPVTQEAAWLHVSVRDTGIGIPAEKRQSIFNAFTRADGSTNRHHGGLGLGLTVASQLVQMMGGRMWVESDVSQGSTFHFTAHVGRQSPSVARSSPSQPTNLASLRVLVADDNGVNRRILHDVLTHWGIQSSEVEGGPSAIAALQSAARAGQPFEVLLLDLKMPDMNGFAVLEQIRRMPEIHLPVIMMLRSADHSGDDARTRALGAAEILIKPIRPSELRDAIDKVTDKSFNRAAGRAEPRRSLSSVVPHELALKILVAEDNPINQLLAVRILTRVGHVVTVANDGEEALAAIARESFDVVMMDVEMPVIDGLEATAQIRLHEKSTGAHLPIIAMTAYALKGDRKKCLEAGMDGYVSKPFTNHELFSAIAVAVSAGRPE